MAGGFGSDLYRGPYVVDREYCPKDFRDEIEARWSIEGTECPFVDSGYLRPDYSVLDEPRLNSYYWWRTNVRKGRLTAVDSGYAWLYCTELVNLDRDPSEVLSRIIDFTRVCGSSMRLSPVVCGLAEEYAIVHRLPLDPIPRERPFSRSEVLLTWDLTRYPLRRPDPDVLLAGDLFDWSKVIRVSDEVMTEIVYLALSGIDEHTRTAQGEGVVRASGCEWDTKQIIPYSRFEDYTGVEAVEMPVIPLFEGPFHDLLDFIVRYAASRLRDDGRRGPTVSKDFPKAYRSIVDSAIASLRRKGVWNAEAFRAPSQDGGFWEDDDLEVDDTEMEQEAVIRPLVYPDTTPPRMTSRELDSNWDEESVDPVDYVASDHTMASYGTMDGSQRAFYIHWRTMARRGVYKDTDMGYLWLYCTELINHDYEPELVQAELERAVDAFYFAFPVPYLLCQVAVDHALLHGFDVPPEPMGTWNRYIASVKLASRPTGRITVGMASLYADYPQLEKYVKGDPRFYERAITRAVRTVDSYMEKRDGKRLIDYADKTEYTTTKRLYQAVWHPDPPVLDLSFVDVIGSKRISSVMEGTVKSVFREINRRLGCSAPRVPEMFPDDLSSVVARVVDGIFGELEESEAMEKRMREASRIVIDRDAVATAADDLTAVTGMMTVEDQVAEEHEPVHIQSSASGGWDALSASLDDVEKAYLLKGKAALAGTGRRPVEVEASINAKAMDAVGDAIVENGEVFEDYRDEILAMKND